MDSIINQQMTGKRLLQLRSLYRAVGHTKQRINELQRLAAKAKFDKFPAEFDELTAIYEGHIKTATQEIAVLESFVNSISEKFLKQIFIDRYCYGMDWIQVALKAQISENSAKSYCQRYFKRHDKQKSKSSSKLHDKIVFTAPKGKKDQIKAIADRNGESINSFINRIVDDAMILTNQADEKE